MTESRAAPPTPLLRAWQRQVRTTYGAGDWTAEIGTPLWRAAAWEQSALNAWARGDSAETVAADLVAPYHQYAWPLTHHTYGPAEHLSDRELEMLECVRYAPSLSVTVKLAVLKLAEREQVDAHHYTTWEQSRKERRWKSALAARKARLGVPA